MTPDSVDAPASEEALVAEYVLQTMPAELRSDFEDRLATDPALNRKVLDYRANLTRLAAILPAVRLPESAWQAVEAEIKRHYALDRLGSVSAPDEHSVPVGCTTGDP